MEAMIFSSNGGLLLFFFKIYLVFRNQNLCHFLFISSFIFLFLVSLSILFLLFYFDLKKKQINLIKDFGMDALITKHIINIFLNFFKNY